MYSIWWGPFAVPWSGIHWEANPIEEEAREYQSRKAMQAGWGEKGGGGGKRSLKNKGIPKAISDDKEGKKCTPT